MKFDTTDVPHHHRYVVSRPRHVL